MNEINTSRPTYAAFLVVFVVGALAGVGVMAFMNRPADTTVDAPDASSTDAASYEQRDQSANSYHFINPLLSCGVDREVSTLGTIRSLKSSVAAYLTDENNKGVITDSSVYFRELINGSGFGINDTAKFTPGSLLKVPLALSIIRKSEDDPTFGKEPVVYDGGAPDMAQTFDPEKTAEVGNSYTLDDLLSLSLVYSDNVATLLLSQMIDRKVLDAAYYDLGVEVPQSGDSYTMTVSTYATFFRILYNATYISREASEKVLSLLSHATFTDGLVAGVPKGTVVAHKFGERLATPDQLQQLHDCGIVYKDKHPYLLCVMLRGKDIHALPDVIASVSRMVYQNLDK